MARLFTKFTTESEPEGTGLSLYISKGIVEDNSGTIRGYNNHGQGIALEFTLLL